MGWCLISVDISSTPLSTDQVAQWPPSSKICFFISLSRFCQTGLHLRPCLTTNPGRTAFFVTDPLSDLKISVFSLFFFFFFVVDVLHVAFSGGQTPGRTLTLVVFMCLAWCIGQNLVRFLNFSEGEMGGDQKFVKNYTRRTGGDL